MWKFMILFCIRLQFGIAIYDYIPEIELDVFSEYGEQKCRGSETTLLHNSTYRVHININKNIYNARCNKMNEWNNAVADDFRPNMNNRPGYMSTTGSIVTERGEWRLECSFYTKNCWINGNQNNYICYYGKENYQANIVKCYILVKVLPAEQIGFLTFDEFNITSMAQQTTRTHIVKEGKAINFKCKKNIDGFVKLAYINKERDSRTFSTSLQTTEKMQLNMKVTAADDEAKITCTIYDKYQKIVWNITVTLNVNGSPETDKGFLGFVVNGLVLPRIANSRSGVYNYEYKYYHTELLNISFVKDEKMYRDEYCGVHGNAPYIVNKYINTHKKFINKPVLATVYYGTEYNISCSVHYVNGGTNPTITASIQFVYKPPDYTPFIGGLTKGNIMMVLKNNTTTIINYYYDESGLHDLRCFDDEFRTDSHTEWHFNPIEVDSWPESSNSPRSFILLNVKTSVILCKSIHTGKVTYLKLIRKEAIDTTTITKIAPHEVETEIHTDNKPTGIAKTPKEPVPITTTSTKRTTLSITSKGTLPYKPIASTTSKTEDILPFSSTESTRAQTDSERTTVSPESGNRGLPVGVIAAVCVIIMALLIAALCAVVIAIKRIKKTRQVNATDIDYQNLPQHNEGPMPLPAQWNSQNDYTARHENNQEHLYSKPIPKSKRSIALEPNYAQVRDANISEPTYAEVENSLCDSDGNEPAYAEVGNNSNYQNFVKNPRESLNYANVETICSGVSKPLNPRSSNYVEIKSPESSYANAQELRNENETLYANIKD